jgi:hypothetical protein
LILGHGLALVMGSWLGDCCNSRGLCNSRCFLDCWLCLDGWCFLDSWHFNGRNGFLYNLVRLLFRLLATSPLALLSEQQQAQALELALLGTRLVVS